VSRPDAAPQAGEAFAVPVRIMRNAHTGVIEESFMAMSRNGRTPAYAC